MTSALASFAVLVLVILAIPLVLWLVKRLSQLPGSNQGPLAVAASLSVGPRERIAVVRVEDRWLLVGITAGSINTLAELPGPLQATEATKPAFAQLLARAAGRGATS
ncbi:MAG: flagellar biosynthetic protein FliO [Lautropia sp.]